MRRNREKNNRHIFVNDGQQRWYFNVLEMEYFEGIGEWKPDGWWINFVNRKSEKKHIELDHEPTPVELYKMLDQ